MRKSSPRFWKSRLRPVVRLPVAGFMSQAQTTPEAINEIDIGKRKILRKRLSPFSF
jgi:hypothetical protein